MHQIIYVLSRVRDTTFDHVNAYRKVDKNYFKILETVLVVLCDIYEEKNLKTNFRRVYTALKQKRKDFFALFFSEFRRLSSILQYSNSMLIDDMKDKLMSRFKKTLINQQVKYIFLSTMKTYLQSLDDDQRTMLIEKKRRKKYEQIRKQTVVVSIKSYIAVAISYKISVFVSTSSDASVVIIVLKLSSSAEISSNAC